GVGGTWYWNRYPGARCDVPSLEYSYGFSKELQLEWEWTEIMPAREEIEEYLNHVVDRFDLGRDIQLATRVTAATFDEATARWLVETDTGEQFSAAFLVMATGCLSAPMTPDIPGRDSFEGRTLQTSLWPNEPVDLTGLRVGLIGTGSSGVQATPEIAKEAAHLYVFQRSAVYSFPAFRGMIDAELVRQFKENPDEFRRQQRAAFAGVAGFGGALGPAQPPARKILETPWEEQLEVIDEEGFWGARAWADVLVDLEANEAGAELFREMIRRTVDDAEVAELLSPRGYPIGCKRLVFGVDYYEAFNRDNVTCVDLRRGAIETITPTGIQTEQGHYDLDVIIFATGFDAMTGALNRIDIRGRDGELLRDAWAAGARTLLGLQSVGFPNLFTVTGPGSPSVLANMVVGVEQHVEWIGECLTYLRDHGHHTIEPTIEAQDAWVEHVNEVAKGTMYTAATCNSWYLGANIPGKPRVFMPYVGGLPAYIQKADAVAAAGYEGFVLA
ncbi:MAG TPA: NAD(P)/FAD-dependent oxidoreductase, partial [Acidimicrobiia bacterium]|nr:NAD(P)/FAD-dependent oxidoreductase [Acidimicrobiia bacterium]